MATVTKARAPYKVLQGLEGEANGEFDKLVTTAVDALGAILEDARPHPDEEKLVSAVPPSAEPLAKTATVFDQVRDFTQELHKVAQSTDRLSFIRAWSGETTARETEAFAAAASKSDELDALISLVPLRKTAEVPARIKRVRHLAEAANNAADRAKEHGEYLRGAIQRIREDAPWEVRALLDQADPGETWDEANRE